MLCCFYFSMLPEKVGKLYVGKDVLFDTMKVSKAMRDLNNKIIECKYDKTRNTWVFMRERTDKSFPNSFNTAIGKYEYLLAFDF